jgi:hypothetical protein
MWTAPTVAEWIESLGIRPGGAVDVELVAIGGPGIWFPDMPDRVAIVEMTAGPGLFMGEGQMDGTEFRLSVRGPQGDPVTADREAELMALAADRLIRAFPTPAVLPDGTYLLSIDRSARPTLVDRGRDGGRVTYATTYTAQVNDEG